MEKKMIIHEEFESLYYYHGKSLNWYKQAYHTHDQYEIILFLTDGAELEIEERLHHCKRGDLFCINRNVMHRSCCAGVYDRYVLMMAEEWVEPYTEAFGYDFAGLFTNDGTGSKLSLSEENMDYVIRAFDEVEACISNNTAIDSNLVELKLKILGLINRIAQLSLALEPKEDSAFRAESSGEETIPETSRGHWPAEASAPEAGHESVVFAEEAADRLSEIKDYIIEHIDDQLRVKNIAEHFELSAPYLSQYFKKSTGFTLSQFMTTQKMKLAKQLLKEGYQVTDVAMRLGYSSASHLITTFKEATGTTPKKYQMKKAK